MVVALVNKLWQRGHVKQPMSFSVGNFTVAVAVAIGRKSGG